MFCPNCGTNVPEGANACPNCGTLLNTAQAAPEMPVSQAPSDRQPPVYHAEPINKAPYSTTPILVFGILALAFADSFFLSFLGIVFGAITRSKVKAYLAEGYTLSGKAKVGSILGKVGFILGIVVTIIFVIYVVFLVGLIGYLVQYA